VLSSDFCLYRKINTLPIIEGVENVQNIKKWTTLYSRRSPYVHKPHPFDSPPQRLVSDLT
jgi:hypothetical protein